MNHNPRIKSVRKTRMVMAAAGLGLVVLAWTGRPDLQWIYLATCVIAVLALAVDIWERLAVLSDYGELLSVPLLLARDQQLLDLYRAVSSSFREISTHFDPIYRDLAIQRLQQLDHELVNIAEGTIQFRSTETWRMSYEHILRSRGLHLYRSVAYAKTTEYWQDEPGRQSMQLNFALVRAGQLEIQRIVIVPDPMWPSAERLPVEPLATWLDEQHRHGILLKLVRVSTLQEEPDLLGDFGIYGNRALGVQEVDDQGRTSRFTLSFDFSEVLAAEQRWQRLMVYATAYADFLREPAP